MIKLKHYFFGFYTIIISHSVLAIDNDLITPSINYLLNSNSSEIQRPVSQHQVSIHLPSCKNKSNPQLKVIKTIADWSSINDPNLRIFCVQPGEYVKDYSETPSPIKITQSGTANQPRYLILDNGNNLHPGTLFHQNKQSLMANIRLFFDNADYWIVDRMSTWEQPHKYSLPIKMNSSSHNIFNRYFTDNVGGSISLYDGSESNIFQNSRFQNMSQQGLFYDRVCIAFSDRTRDSINVKIRNNKILNNEFVNCNDGIQLVRQSRTSSPLDYSGTLIDHNDISINSAIYTDCTGQLNPQGTCAYAENAIDIKSGAEDSNNPVIISNNKMWGFRKSDSTGEENYIDDPGTAMALHYGSKNVNIINNLIFDSARGVQISDATANGKLNFAYALSDSNIINNQFINIHNDVDSRAFALINYTSDNILVKGNLFQDTVYRWLVSSSTGVTNAHYNCNFIINTFSGINYTSGIKDFNSFLNTTAYRSGKAVLPIGDGNRELTNPQQYTETDISFKTDYYGATLRTIPLSAKKLVDVLDECR